MKNLAQFKYNVRLRLTLCLLQCFGASWVWAESEEQLASILKSASMAVRTQNFEQAATLYRQAADAGSAEAQYQMASLYNLGRGVKADKEKARFWFEKASFKNHAAAQYQLALLLQREQPEDAQRLLESAAQSGNSSAIAYLQRIGNNIQQNTAMTDAERWFNASGKGQLKLMASLLPSIGGVDTVDEHGRSALHYAIESGRYETLNWLVKQGANINLRDEFNNAPVFAAIDTGDKEILTRLLKANVDLNAVLPNGDTALHFTLRRKRYDLLPLLLAYPLAINQQNKEGWTALDLAEFAHADKAVGLLQRHKAKHGKGWQTQSQPEQRVALMSEQLTADNSLNLEVLAKVVSSGNTALLETMLNSATDTPRWVNESTEGGYTLLGLAIRQGRKDMVRSLLTFGAKPRQLVDGQLTALQFAAQEGQGDIADLLLGSGAILLAANKSGQDAIELALNNYQEELALSLLQRGKKLPVKLPYDRYAYSAAQVKSQAFIEAITSALKEPYVDALGRTAVWYAAKNSDAQLLTLLLQHNAGANLADSSGKTPLIIAAEQQCFACLPVLLPVSEINAQSGSGNTALMASVMNSDLKSLNWLIAQGADTEIRNNLGDTALIIAAKNNSLEIAQRLIKAGASPARKNKSGRSARDIAKQQSAELMQLMR